MRRMSLTENKGDRNKTRLRTCKFGKSALTARWGSRVTSALPADEPSSMQQEPLWWGCQCRGGEASLCRSVIRCLPLCAPINVLSHGATPDGSKRCVLLAGVSPSLHSTLAAVLDCSSLTKPDLSLPADSWSPVQAVPGCMVVLRLLQRLNKCRKGRKVSVRRFLWLRLVWTERFLCVWTVLRRQLTASLRRRRRVHIWPAFARNDPLSNLPRFTESTSRMRESG